LQVFDKIGTGGHRWFAIPSALFDPRTDQDGQGTGAPAGSDVNRSAWEKIDLLKEPVFSR
jgi:hypothetical protein